MIQYFYTLDYQTSQHLPDMPDIDEKHDQSFQLTRGETNLADSELVLHTKAYILADKYIIPGLKALALNKFKAAAGQYWCPEYFLLAVEEAYTYTVEGDRGIRDVIIQIFDKHEELLSRCCAEGSTEFSCTSIRPQA